MNLPDGHLLQNGKYRLIHVVGQGGFGITYRGVWYTEVKGSLGAVKTGIPIAVKEYFFKDYCYREKDSYAVKVHSETGKSLFQRFKEKQIKEARILSEVHHPHIVNVLEVFEENNTAYIAMEYISGLSLKQIMDKEGVFPEAKVLKYIRQIGEALQFVHEKNILHLDIKPSNILVDKNDNARLIDFGVSKRYDDEQQETSTTMLTLSKGFASIEQYDSEGTQIFSPYPDVYSLGATMYNMLTGRIPTESILRATRPLATPGELNLAVTAKTEQVIIKAMQIVPTERFQTVGQMMEALDMPGEEGGALPPESKDTAWSLPGEKPPQEPDEQTTVLKQSPVSLKRKKKRMLITALLAAAMLVVSAITYSWYADRHTAAIHFPPEDSGGGADPETVVKESVFTGYPGNTQQADAQQPDTQQAIVTSGAPEETATREQSNPLEKPSSEEVSPPSSTDTEAVYAKLLASGLRKTETADYAGAKADFLKANELKPSAEIVSRINDADRKIEEKRIADQYDVKNISFGNLKIVMKYSNRLYGAIDANGVERIPCIYLNNEKAGNGRAFERDDNLFDIYNAEGERIKEGVTGYY
jgi:serine/threonine-protein kinase